MRPSLKSIYHKMATDGTVRHDDAQLAAIEKLEILKTHLETTSDNGGPLIAAFRKRSKPSVAKGIYLWGGVGAGKSMLMDVFFAATDIDRKRRVHFHAFMQEIHAALHLARKQATDDPIAGLADKIAKDTRLLCFDEMHITDITDAMIVGRLFAGLFNAGVSVVTTSNRAPDDLYKDGLNRQLFLPFIDLLNQRMEVHHLFTETDYRQIKLCGEQTYFCPLDAASKAALDRIWTSLADGNGAPLILTVNARSVMLPLHHNGVARASFGDLCATALGPADYLAISGAIRVLVLDGIPKMTRSRKNEAKRFSTLIDTLYEARVILICSAEAEPERLYDTGMGSFEFARTASRLREMQSADWAADL